MKNQTRDVMLSTRGPVPVQLALELFEDTLRLLIQDNLPSYHEVSFRIQTL